MLTPGAAWGRRLAALLGCLAVGVLAAILWLRLSSDGPSPTSSSPAGDRTTADAAKGRRLRASDAPDSARIERALARSVSAAAGLGGEVEAAAMADGWPTPLIETSEPTGASRYMRMWSMSKVVTMIALLRRLGWGAQPGESISPELAEALHGALIRSENCRQRRVVLELERASGGAAGARAALAGVFRASGAGARIGTAVEAPESDCVPYLQAQAEISDPLAPALLLGTSRWRVGDAVRLVHALAVERFGAAVSNRVLGLMRAPKLASREVAPGELTAPLDWGAGEAFAGLDPAYKAGWGGSLNGNFLAGQIALIPLPDGGHLALAAIFHPDAQPSRDDPGITAAPRAIELVMRALRKAVE